MRRNLPHASVGLLFCCLTLCTSGCYNMNGYVMNASGHGYYEQGNYAMAAREFQTALQSNPYNPDYMANLAKARQKMGDPHSAEQLFRQGAFDGSIAPTILSWTCRTDVGKRPDGRSIAVVDQHGQQHSRTLQNPTSNSPGFKESWGRITPRPERCSGRCKLTQATPPHWHIWDNITRRLASPDQAIAMYQRSLQSDWGQPEVHSQIAVAAQQAGPNHPMGEMAMSRGVHPHSLARQPELFGNPNAPMMAYPNSPRTSEQLCRRTADSPNRNDGPTRLANTSTAARHNQPPDRERTRPRRV